MTKFYLTGAMAFFMLTASFSQTTVTLTASKDAAIGYHDGASTAANNYGSAIQNAAYCIPASASPPPGVNMNRALIDFNLSSLPSNATILTASINLYATGPIGSLQGHTGSANASYLERITQSWGEFTVTWNNQPATTSVNSVILPQSTSSNQNYLNINVKPLVQDMISNSSTSFGFLLKLVNESVTNGLLFYSKDNSNPALAPKLVITYSVNTAGLHETSAENNNLVLYPNPSTGIINASYSLPNTDRAELVMEDIQGKFIKTYPLNPNEKNLQINGLDLAPGIYVCKIISGAVTIAIKKLVISK
ncbi:MAG: DNRLRE domain-containing protein [Bacteroidetes bacterium]|nr:DNRLRE domain-containing protein [Bacteroidota bacterium]